VKRTFYIALSRLLEERDLVGSGRMGLILSSDCLSTRHAPPTRLAYPTSPPPPNWDTEGRTGRSP